MVLRRDTQCHYFNVLSKEVEMKDSYKYAELNGLSPSLLLYWKGMGWKAVSEGRNWIL
jgi:hypothetical protein